MNQFSRTLPMMLYRTLDAVMPAFREIFSEFGLTERQWRVLRVLWEHDGRSLLALAQATLIPGPSLVGVVDRLARDGLVERRRSDIDRRVVNIFVTRKGKALERTVQPRVDTTYAALEASVSPATWRSLFKAMDEIVGTRAVRDGTATHQ
jgi:MarR family transcriptional regulator, organic hydroperoxide resistance regulator